MPPLVEPPTLSGTLTRVRQLWLSRWSVHDGPVNPKVLTRRELRDLATSLQALLDVIHRAEMTASTATTYRLEGAVIALETALSDPGATVTGSEAVPRG